MTNHPHRKRDENEPPAEALDPAAVPLHTGNGAAPGLAPNAAKIIGQTIADALTETLPQLLAQALAAATRPEYCDPCLTERLNWEIAHEADLKAAVDQMNTAAMAMQPGDPRLAQMNPFMFLPPHLLPSQDPASPHPDAIPDPSFWSTMRGGTLYCTRHLPGVNRPGEAPKPQLLVAEIAAREADRVSGLRPLRPAGPPRRRLARVRLRRRSPRLPRRLHRRLEDPHSRLPRPHGRLLMLRAGHD